MDGFLMRDDQHAFTPILASQSVDDTAQAKNDVAPALAPGGRK
jgi:hypothetical protein